MKIDTIHYSRKMSDGNYGNLELGMHAQLEDTDDPAQAAADLRAHVEGVLGKERHMIDQETEIEGRVSDLQLRLEHKEQQVKRMEERWAQAKAFLEQHGLDTSRYHEHPF